MKQMRKWMRREYTHVITDGTTIQYDLVDVTIFKYFSLFGGRERGEVGIWGGVVSGFIASRRMGRVEESV